jgi:hypothetical protein
MLGNFPTRKLPGENLRRFSENVGKIPDGKISGENFREIPGKFPTGKFPGKLSGKIRGKFIFLSAKFVKI